jgi:hypothetical protein
MLKMANATKRKPCGTNTLVPATKFKTKYSCSLLLNRVFQTQLLNNQYDMPKTSQPCRFLGI